MAGMYRIAMMKEKKSWQSDVGNASNVEKNEQTNGE